MARYSTGRNGTDGLTRQEREILASWDDGNGPFAVAQATGHPLTKVKDVIATYGAANEHRDHCNAMVAGNQAFLAALAAA